MLGYISPALFMFTVHIAMEAFQADVIFPLLNGILTEDTVKQSQNKVFVYIIDFIYVLMFLGLIFYSMHLTNK
jgi:hypothetical protein